MSSTADADAGETTEAAGDELPAERFDLSAITAVQGRLDDRGTVDIEIDGDVVVTARVESIHAGEHECPVEGCVRRFEEEQGLNIHLGHAHDLGTERVCPECGETFRRPPSQDHQYCSWGCYKSSRTAETDCNTCGVTFEYKTSRDNVRYCSNPCRYEGMRNDPRPDDLSDLLHELYVEEDRDKVPAAERALANLGHDSEWTIESLSEEIDRQITGAAAIPDGLTYDEVEAAIEANTHLREAAADLGIDASDLRVVVYKLGWYGDRIREGRAYGGGDGQ